MVDLSYIGRDGFMIQYEDLISLWGYNVLHNLKEKINVLRRMSDKDILLAYINREIEDPSEYIKKTYDIDFPMEKMYQSEKILRPNLVYASRLFDTAYKNGVTKLSVYSNQYSPVIESYVKQIFTEFHVDYKHGDLKPILRTMPNHTFITSNTNNIRQCGDYEVPFVLSIVDDFMYVAPIIMENVADQLREKNIFVGFTGVISAGVIP